MLRKILRKLLIFTVMLAWILSGWPQIWNNPRIPPEIRRVYAATLPTLRPTTPDGTILNYQNESDGTTNLYASIDDDPDSPTTADYVKNSANANASVFFNITDTSSDFASMDTLQIDFYLNAPANWSNDTGTLYAQVFQSDEASTLTSEHQLATHSTGAGYYSVTFTTVTGSDKTTWDGARLKLRLAYAKTKGPDYGQIQVAAIELDGTYTVASTISITLSTDGSVAFGTLALEAVEDTTVSGINDVETVSVDSGPADLDVRSTTFAEGGNIWTLNTANGSNQVKWEFSEDGSAWTTFAVADTLYALDVNVAQGQTRDLYLRLTMPTFTGSYSQYGATVTIVASVP